MTSSVRFNAKTEARIERVARRRGVTKSAYIRDAVEAQIERDESDPHPGARGLLEEFGGKYESGDPEASARDVGDIIRAKHRRIRAGHDRRSR